ncbi:hypothetical protein SAMN04487897_10650 [Paenibacillus sp. yr247]|uniref:hypothetical protein n=1 Tax=Paenibacillus sp. yr247 TaxID=1761880 RepID=UPI000889A1C0|nr:hypothetical protein [Paenibacillus sp. yr247]SDN93533.1 hypothetical protein SAMN04487897_10650 [Paenibacillus sp. yr247]
MRSIILRLYNAILNLLVQNLGTTWNCTCVPYSNWSVVAEEIARLAALDKVENIEVEYEFHKEYCEVSHLNPFKHSGEFYRRGKSSGNSQKWQCKKCKKITNVMPSRRESTTYHQKRNDILPDLAAQLLNRTPVKRSCEMLGIGSKTYYSKLEWLYRRCLEFLERHDAKAFESINFDKMWVNTDKMIYNLNNVRKRGQGGQRFDDIEEQQFPTHMYRKWAKKPIEHPLPSIDQGKRFVDCTTDLSSYEIEHVANMLVKVNDKATSAFMQQIRRRLSILERPLVTARGEGKSYIYANFNPKYAQYALTILRTFYNFCLPYNSWDKVKVTPAQRLGIADKQFTMKDIIYFK